MTIYLSTQFEVHECVSCGIAFAITQEYSNRRSNDHQEFSCPDGHKQFFSAKSDLEKMKDARDACRSDADMWEDHADSLRESLDYTKRSRAAIKGHNTRLRATPQQ